MDIPTPIANRAGDVDRLFSGIVSQLQVKLGSSGDQAIFTTISVDEIGDVRDRFRLWAGNIGARNPPESKFSLESRLASANELLEQVADLLGDLADALDDLLEIVAGNHDNRTIQGYDISEETKEKDEAHDILDVASECIRSLLQISILIRKATPRDRFTKALQANSGRSRPFIDQFDISHVAERYPKLRNSASKWLCERLGRAITTRRQFLRYARQHGSRVSGATEWSEEVEEEKATQSILARNAFVVSQDATGRSSYSSAAVSGLGSASEGAHTRPSTKASTLDVGMLMLLEGARRENEDNKSYVSASSFHLTGNGDATLRLPTLTEVSKGEAMFECPYCIGIQIISKESEWRQHAFADLRAYVCTLGGGHAECDTSFFGDSHAWFDHEVQCHRGKWVCLLCQEGPFKTRHQMEGHAWSNHRHILTQDGQLQIMVDASQQSVDTLNAEDCPFCDDWAETLKASTPVPEGVAASDIVITVDPTQFRRHVAFHQEQLALFALPRTSDDEDIEKAPDGSLSGGISNHSQKPECENEIETHDTEQRSLWFSDPPLHLAAASGHTAEVERLLKEGADPLAQGETWKNIFEAARSFQNQMEGFGHVYTQKIDQLVRLYARSHWGDVFPGDGVIRIRTSRIHRFWELDKGLEGFGQPADEEPSEEQPTEGTESPTSSRTIPTRSNWARPQRIMPMSEESDGDDYEYTRPSILARYDLGFPRERGSRPGGSHPGPRRDWDSESADGVSARPDERPSTYTGFEDWKRRGCKPHDEGSRIPIRGSLNSHDHDALSSEGEGDIESHQSRDRTRARPNPSSETAMPPRQDGEADTPAKAILKAHKDEVKQPVKGILKKPTPSFPEDPHPFREGVTVHMDNRAKKEIPAGARWTKINRKFVNPEALVIGKERFEVRDDFVIVLRVLSKEEIEAYAAATVELRERRKRARSRKTVVDWTITDDEETVQPPPVEQGPGQTELDETT
ncbi:hypothetical protein B0H63DRAFT_85606 [Podospora didyma]|uniref:Ankyrin repeat protein n=1 Tax=Podospora didyma TaxID=330526 RepID=A0AAE0N1T5_9PEZI|nr:hypothetical protein B0H63DRAFT_85606 [Podospora didyma]